MSKFRIMYEVDSYDINSALNLAHTLLFTQEIDVENVKVEPVTTDPGRTFADPVAEAYKGSTTEAKVNEAAKHREDLVERPARKAMEEDDKPRFFDKVLGWLDKS